MKRKVAKRIAIVGLACALTLSAAGCAKKGANEKKVGSGEMPKTLTVFAPISANATKAGAVDKNDILMYQIAEERRAVRLNG